MTQRNGSQISQNKLNYHTYEKEGGKRTTKKRTTTTTHFI